LVIGRLAASRGRRALVCLSNAPSRYADLLGDVFIDSKIRSVSSLLDVVNLEPRASQEEYGLKVLRNRTLHRLIFGSRIVRGFLDAVPGLAEWAMLGKATHHALGGNGDKPEYDLVVFDSPATGHGLDILALPRAIVSAVPTGRMREEAHRRCELLEDPIRSEIVPVTLAEEMSVNETAELVTGLGKLGLTVERIAVNMVVPQQIDSRLAKMVQCDELPSWLRPTAAALGREKLQEENLEQLKSRVSADQIKLPMITGNLDEASLLLLVDAFSKGLNKM
jgi:anion-transporting  ArsA/GET3 family ATPase